MPGKFTGSFSADVPSGNANPVIFHNLDTMDIASVQVPIVVKETIAEIWGE